MVLGVRRVRAATSWRRLSTTLGGCRLLGATQSPEDCRKCSGDLLFERQARKGGGSRQCEKNTLTRPVSGWSNGGLTAYLGIYSLDHIVGAEYQLSPRNDFV